MSRLHVSIVCLSISAMGWSTAAWAENGTLFGKIATDRSFVAAPTPAFGATPATFQSGRMPEISPVTTQAYSSAMSAGNYPHPYHAATHAQAIPTAQPPGVSPAAFEVDSSSSETWVKLAPYAWVTEIHGDVTAFGVTQSVDVSISDIFEAIGDGALRGAAQGHVEAGKGKWGFIFDGMIVSLAPSKDLGFAQADFLIEQTLLEVMGTYRVAELRTGQDPASSAGLAVELLGGGRYYSFKNAIDIDGNGPLRVDAGIEQSVNWVDLVIGGRVQAEIMDIFSVWVRGDYGGFNLGTSSKRAWGLTAGMEVRCSPGASIIYGYRILDIDESQGNGRRAFGFNAQMRGPMLAFNFRF